MTAEDDQSATIPKRRVRPRAPSRDRGMLRYTTLLDATEALLQDQSPDDIGLYQIAEKANVPPASVYHFFPTKDAAFLALAKRYLDGFDRLGREPVPASGLESWQALMAHDQRMALNYYNAHPPALKIFLGGYGGEQTRQADRIYNERTARLMHRRYDLAFHVPYIKNYEAKFHIVVEILDAIWAISYLRYGRITEEYYQEGLSACTSYLGLYLPVRMELRQTYGEMVTRGAPVLLGRSEELAASSAGDPQ